jgi:hypothetical protein
MARKTLQNVAVKDRGSKAANKPIKSKMMMDDNFEKKCPIITKKAEKHDMWDYLFIAIAVLGVAMIVNGIYLIIK